MVKFTKRWLSRAQQEHIQNPLKYLRCNLWWQNWLNILAKSSILGAAYMEILSMGWNFNLLTISHGVCYVSYIFFGSSLGKISFIIVRYVRQILGRGAFLPFLSHPWAAILNRVNRDKISSCMASENLCKNIHAKIYKQKFNHDKPSRNFTTVWTNHAEIFIPCKIIIWSTIKINESRYITLFVVSGSILKVFSID